MKNNFFLMIYSFLFFLLNSCTWAGSDSEKGVSTEKNENGFLFKKIPTDFDWKFGYETLIFKQRSDSSSMFPIRVFIPKQIWEKLPTPNDTIAVEIQYLNGIEYGSRNTGISVWDVRFNLCINFRIDTLLKSKIDTLVKR